MPRKLIAKLPFQEVEDEILFTQAALAADPDAKDLVPLTESWISLINKAQATELELRREVAHTDAARMVANARLDQACMAFGDELWLAADKDRTSPRFKQFFQDAPNRFVRIALPRQIAQVRAWLSSTDPVFLRHKPEIEKWVQATERLGTTNLKIGTSEAQTMSDSALRSVLFPSGRGGESATIERAPFDCGHVHVELRRQGVTLLLLWQEHIADCEKVPLKPCSYSQFCDRYALYKKRLCRSVRISNRAGEKVFVDYSGKKARVFDRTIGEMREVEIFVMTLAASGYSYAEASWLQTVPDFCSSLMRGFDFLGGVPEVLVPDQLRSAVSKPCRYDPEIHRTLADLAAHYQVTVLPARPRKPKDKAKVEGAACSCSAGS